MNSNFMMTEVSGKQVGSINIDANEIYTFKLSCNFYTIRSVSLFLGKTSNKTTNIELEICNKEYNKPIVKSEVKGIVEGWIVFEFPLITGIYDETLILKIKSNNSINIGCDKFKDISLQIYHDNLDDQLGEELDSTKKELDKIYNSTGWILIVSLYKIRDSIKGTIKYILRLISMLFVIIRSINISNIVRCKDFLKENGFKAFMYKVINKIKGDRLKYHEWIKHHVPTELELDLQRKQRFEYEPTVSILVPTYKTPIHLLIETIDSVINQSYRNWELCIADGNSEDAYINKMLDEYAANDNRIKIKYLDENKGIAGNTQECYYMATGDYIGLFDHDDLLEPNALFEIVKAVNEDREIDFIYTDEDKINEKSTLRFDPNFKQDFSIDTFRSCNYICHFSVFRKDLMAKINGFRDGYNGSQDYDIILRATDIANKIHHIPKILYSWRVHSGSTAGNPRNKMYCYDAAKKAIDDELQRNNIAGKTLDGKYIGTYEVEYEISGTPKVSIVISTKDSIKELDRAVNSILSKTSYNNYEIIIINKDSSNLEFIEYLDELQKASNIKYITWDKEYNYSEIRNYGASFAEGEFILFLESSIEVINGNWLGKMLSIAQRKDVGCVGAKLYYDDDTIQHGGMIIGIRGGAAYAHRTFRKKEYGYFLRLGITHNLSAVSGECLIVKRSVFDQVNGLDGNYANLYGDVDFCLRILEIGKVNVWTPYAELYNHIPKVRDKNEISKNNEKFLIEFNLFKERYKEFIEKGDPYYNPNLTLDKEDFSLRI